MKSLLKAAEWMLLSVAAEKLFNILFTVFILAFLSYISWHIYNAAQRLVY